MAFLRSSLGFFSGKLQNNVFKETDLGNVVSSLGKYSAPMDPASLTRRTKFSFTVKLAAAIIRLLSIKVLWQRTAPFNDRCLNKVFKKNYKRVSPILMDISKVILSANTQFSPKNPEVNITSTGIEVTTAALAGQGLTTDEKKIAVEGILCLSSPTDDSLPTFHFIPVRSADQTLVLNDSISFTLPIVGGDASMAQDYATKSVVLTMVTKDAEGNPVKSSTTFAN